MACQDGGASKRRPCFSAPRVSVEHASRIGTIGRPSSAEPGAGETFEVVLSAARARKAWAWEAIYGELSPTVTGYLRAQGAIEPDDLSGEVFLQVVRDLKQFEGGEGEFRAWVFTIAHNRLVDQRRALARRPPAIPTEEIEPWEAAEDVEGETLDRVAAEGTRSLLNHLTDEQQSVLLLRVIGNLTTAQVAEALGCTPGAAKALQRRGLATLKRALSESTITR